MSAFALQRILPVLLASALGSGSICAQEETDKLSAAELEKLDGLRLDYDLAREEITQKQWVEPMEKLRNKYREGMQKVQDRFSQTGDLTKALAARTAAKVDPTVATINANVREIAAVQRNFIVAQEKIQKRRDESLVKLARSHVAQLTAIKDRLTKAKRLDSALVVQQAIDELEYPSLILGGSKKFKDGIVAYYPFNGNAKDVSGNGNHGVVKGATLAIDRYGKVGGCYHFDGKAYIAIPNGIYFDGEFTVSGWVYLDEHRPWSRLFDFANEGRKNHVDLCLSVNSSGLLQGNVDGNGNVKAKNKIPLKRWVHIAWTFKKPTSFIYGDGAMIAEAKCSSLPASVVRTNNWIGRSNWENAANSRPIKGKIDDIRIYNRALSAKEVSALYLAEKP